jgi:hypothetical protein
MPIHYYNKGPTLSEIFASSFNRGMSIGASGYERAKAREIQDAAIQSKLTAATNLAATKQSADASHSLDVYDYADKYESPHQQALTRVTGTAYAPTGDSDGTPVPKGDLQRAKDQVAAAKEQVEHWGKLKQESLATGNNEVSKGYDGKTFTDPSGAVVPMPRVKTGFEDQYENAWRKQVKAQATLAEMQGKLYGLMNGAPAAPPESAPGGIGQPSPQPSPPVEPQSIPPIAAGRTGQVVPPMNTGAATGAAMKDTAAGGGPGGAVEQAKAAARMQLAADAAQHAGVEPAAVDQLPPLTVEDSVQMVATLRQHIANPAELQKAFYRVAVASGHDPRKTPIQAAPVPQGAGPMKITMGP